ncbi:phage portal protein [Gracilibacillus dipsosauri]|nr:phage portal protein [Gracilibacillus dipsosauri]
MGLIKGMKDLKELKEININEEMYNYIDMWKALYEGYYQNIHDMEYHTIGEGTKTRRMLTLGMAKVISEEMASLVFNEKCEINIDDDKLKKFIDDAFRRNKFNKHFQDYIEYKFAMGGMVIKPYIKDGKLVLSFTTADCFLPISWNNQGIYEGVFLDEFKKDNKWYTHLEWHLWEERKGIDYLVIKHTLHVSDTQGQLGVDITSRFEEFFPGITKYADFPITKRKKANSFVYFKPNIANNKDTLSPLGISLFANALDTLKALDTAFDSFHREFRLGKKRILIPSQMVKTVIDPNTQEVHRYFDANDETYEALKYNMPEDGKIQDISVDLREEEHINAINAHLNILAMQTGFSAGTFTFDGQSMKTATEVISEQSKTFKSKKSHETIIESGLNELVDSIVQIAELYEIDTFTEDYEVTVAFDDSIVEDKAAELEKVVVELTNGLKPKYMIIADYYGIPEDEAKKWLQEIKQEQIDSVPDRDEIIQSTTMFGSEE